MEAFESYQVISQFPLEGTLLEAVPYGSGHINDTYRLTFGENGKQKQYILQRINNEIFRNPDELMLYTALNLINGTQSGTQQAAAQTVTVKYNSVARKASQAVEM